MIFLKYFYLTVISVFGIIILIYAFLSKKPIKILLFNAIAAFFSLGIINFTSKYSGVYIPINEYSIALSGVFGLPAVCSFLIFPIIFL